MTTLIVNFGGPRSQEEVEEFLIALLNDRDLIQTKLPSFIHRWLFTRIAKKRSIKVREDYAEIGGGSPIFQDTENIAKELSGQILTFHRYLPATHKAFIEKIESSKEETIRVFPLFPQFSYATTGSIARFFQENLSSEVVKKLEWIKSYPASPHFILPYKEKIETFLKENKWKEEETLLIYSCHGVPMTFECGGDPYRKECELSFKALSSYFPKAKNLLSYQSQFGKARWLLPSTKEVVKNIENHTEEKKNILFIPLSFTSDHIETLFEIEEEYVGPLKDRFNAKRLPALSLDWAKNIMALLKEEHNVIPNQMLLRQKNLNYCKTLCARCKP